MHKTKPKSPPSSKHEPPVSEPNNRDPDEKEVDIDDAAIEEPKDNVFEQKDPER
jgi:hypothetical protein